MAKMKTQEQYLQNLKDLGMTGVPLEQYRGYGVKILHSCGMCGKAYNVSPSGFLNSGICPECAKTKESDKKRWTNEEYLEKLKERNIKTYPIQNYIDYHTGIMHVCCSCGEPYIAIPANVLKGCLCKKCGNEKARLSALFTNEYFLNRLKTLKVEAIPLEEYNGKDCLIKFLCPCGNEFLCTPNSIYNNVHCPECTNKKNRERQLFTNEQYIRMLKENNIKTKNLEDYDGYSKKIAHRCTCGRTYLVSPSSVLKGSNCPICWAKKISKARLKTRESYISELENGEYGVKLLGEYLGSRVKVEHRCSCGNTWMVCPASVLMGSKCPKCRGSRGEDAIAVFLDKHFLKYDRQFRFQDCIDRQQLPFDFALVGESEIPIVMIEFDGRQHYDVIEWYDGEEGLKLTQYHDSIKNEYCKSHNIPLIRIPYWDFDKIPEILTEKLHL